MQTVPSPRAPRGEAENPTVSQKDLYRLPHGDVVALATRARNKLRNAEMDKARITERAMAVGIGSAAALGAGYVMAGLDADAETAGSTGTDEDPSLLFGFAPVDLVGGLVATAAGVFMSGKPSTRKVGELLEAAGSGIVNGVAYQYGYEMGGE